MDRQMRRDEILLATLPHIAFEGWTDKAIRAGLADCGLTPEQGRLAFMGGVDEMIDHWVAWSDQRMLEVVSRLDLPAMRVRERVATAVRARLEVNIPYREAVRRTLAYLALPVNAPMAARLTWRTVDAVWYAAGDTATDINYYTKRALLAGVYASTTLYWLDDDSEAFTETWGFLDRRLGDVLQITKLRGRIGGLFGGLRPPVGLPSGLLARLRSVIPGFGAGRRGPEAEPGPTV